MNRPGGDTGYGVTTIDAQYIKPGIASLQLLIAAGHAAFIDTGTSRSLPHVAEVLAAKGIATGSVDFVIPTHVHLDHAGGAGAMMRAFPNARLIVHPRGARHMIDPARLWQGTLDVYGEITARKLYGELIPVEEHRVVIAGDNFELDFHGRRLRFLDTPGHARHHLCVVDAENRLIFAGDTLGISYRMFDGPNGPFVFPTSSPVQFEPDALHRSIDRLMSSDPHYLYLTHFGKIAASSKIADALHRQINGFVSIATGNSGSAQPIELRKQIAGYMLEEAKLHGVPLPDNEIRAGLAMDAKLNADGIAVWLSRQKH